MFGSHCILFVFLFVVLVVRFNFCGFCVMIFVWVFGLGRVFGLCFRWYFFGVGLGGVLSVFWCLCCWLSVSFFVLLQGYRWVVGMCGVCVFLLRWADYFFGGLVYVLVILWCLLVLLCGFGLGLCVFIGCCFVVLLCFCVLGLSFMRFGLRNFLCYVCFCGFLWFGSLFGFRWVVCLSFWWYGFVVLFTWCGVLVSFCVAFLFDLVFIVFFRICVCI